MNPKNQKVIDLIQKLLALANSDNEHEAKLAASRAQELLIRHNLTLEDCEPDDKYNMQVVDTGMGRAPTEWKYVQSILGEFFYVKIIHMRKPVFNKETFKYSKHMSYVMCGQQHNIEIAKFVRDFLTNSFIKLFNEYRNRTGAPTTSKTSFYIGLYSGLAEQLRATQTKVQTETGLVIIPEHDLQPWIEEQLGKIKQNKPAKQFIEDQQAVNEGFDKGKNLKIARGIESRSNGEIKRLT